MDFWHVDLQEKYSNGTTDFRNRGRLVSSEAGYYELESIRPIPTGRIRQGIRISGAAPIFIFSRPVQGMSR